MRRKSPRSRSSALAGPLAHMPGSHAPARRPVRSARPVLEPMEGRLLLTAGSLDPTFGTDGIVTTDFNTPNPTTAFCTLVQPDGKIVSAGQTVTVNGTIAAVSRLNPDGSPDTTFGQGGLVTIPTVPTYGGARTVAEQPDGKILLGDFGLNNWIITRLNPDGSLDTTFGTNGTITPSFHVVPGQPGTQDGAGAVWGLAVQSNGDIIASGDLNFGATGADTAVARFLPSGAPDPTFGTRGDGLVVDDLLGHGLNDGGGVVVLQADGKIVVAANTGTPGGYNEMAAERLNPDGSLDAGFGTGGAALIPLQPSYANSIALAPDSSIVLAGGFNYGGGYYECALARLTPSGQLDGSFGAGGILLDQLAAGNGPYTTSSANGVIVQPDGKIVAAGGEADDPGTVQSIALARYNTDGTPDASFGASGHVVFNPLNADAGANGVALQSDGGIIAVAPGFLVARFTPSGQPDATFHGSGYAVSSFDGSHNDYGGPVAVLPSGKILQAGSTVDGTGAATYALAQYNPDGSLDTTFGTSGRVVVAPFSGSGRESNANTILLQSDGKFVLAGWISDNGGGGNESNFRFGVVRYNADGSLDTTFGSGGSSTVSFNDGDFLTGAAITPTSDIVLVGNDPSYPLVVAELTPDGLLDPSFGSGGKEMLGVGGAGSVVVQSDGKILVAGTTQVSGVEDYALVRLNPDGSLDPGFGSGGLQVANVDGENSYAAGLALLPDGRFYVAGSVGGNYALHPYDGFTIALTRFLPSGQPDSSFGTSGSSVVPYFTLAVGHDTSQGQARGLVVQADGKVVVGGIAINYTGNETDMVAARFLPTGSLDPSFGNGGRASYAVNPGFDSEGTSGVALQPDNKILLGGWASQTGTGVDFALLRIEGGPLATSSLSGVVFEDFNDDGQVDFGEQGIPGVSIALTGTDVLGDPVNLCQSTDADGAYVFLNLLPGTYTITETQPAGYTEGINTVGTAGGSVTGDQFTVALAGGIDGLNYNFGERPTPGSAVSHGQTAGIGFWNNKNGQALIKALNGGGASARLGDWLAATFPHMFGADSGANDLSGQTIDYIASFFQARFVVHGQKLDAQVLATALNVYVTNATLDDTGVGTQYGFIVSGDGLGTATYRVGTNGDAFGVADNTVMTVLDILLAADAQAVDGVLYNGDTTKRTRANNVFSAINEAGDIS